VLFSPGTGGNHVANMLATATSFESRVDDNAYNCHEDNNAHYSTIKNLNFNTIHMIDPAKNNVLCGHWLEYYILLLENKIQFFQNRQIFILEYPQKNTLALNRVHTLNNLSEYFAKEQESIYSIEIIQRCFSEEDIHVYSADKIFQENIDEFYSFAKTEMSMCIDRHLCASMHDKWFKMISTHYCF